MGEHLPEHPALTLSHVATLLVTSSERHKIGILGYHEGARDPVIVDGHILAQHETFCSHRAMTECTDKDAMGYAAPRLILGNFLLCLQIGRAESDPKPDVSH